MVMVFDASSCTDFDSYSLCLLNLGFEYNPKFYTCWLKKGHELLHARDCYIVSGLDGRTGSLHLGPCIRALCAPHVGIVSFRHLQRHSAPTGARDLY
jgi:hypothetical protein